jgi:hypothetical protein
VFLVLGDAAYFSQRHLGTSVHACEFKHSRFRHFWRWVTGVKHDGSFAPSGTRWADAVKTLD